MHVNWRHPDCVLIGCKRKKRLYRGYNVEGT